MAVIHRFIRPERRDSDCTLARRDGLGGEIVILPCVRRESLLDRGGRALGLSALAHGGAQTDEPIEQMA